MRQGRVELCHRLRQDIRHARPAKDIEYLASAGLFRQDIRKPVDPLFSRLVAGLGCYAYRAGRPVNIQHLEVSFGVSNEVECVKISRHTGYTTERDLLLPRTCMACSLANAQYSQTSSAEFLLAGVFNLS